MEGIVIYHRCISIEGINIEGIEVYHRCMSRNIPHSKEGLELLNENGNLTRDVDEVWETVKVESCRGVFVG